MRKIMLMALSLIFISTLLFGCQTKENTAKTPIHSTDTSENNQKLLINNDFKSIIVSKNKGVDEVSIDDKESIKALQSILSSAVKEPGIVDMAAPEFYLEVVYDKENYKSFYLWVGEKGQRSTFMKTEDTHTIYTVEDERTVELIDLIESHF